MQHHQGQLPPSQGHAYGTLTHCHRQHQQPISQGHAYGCPYTLGHSHACIYHLIGQFINSNWRTGAALPGAANSQPGACLWLSVHIGRLTYMYTAPNWSVHYFKLAHWCSITRSSSLPARGMLMAPLHIATHSHACI